ncbi:MAG: O-antigen ligase family protein [Gammaproteobacteria bacterium]
MMDGDLATTLFGMGAGSYPRTYFLFNSENTIPATYKIESEFGNEYLRLRGGDPLYYGQYIDIEPNTRYRLKIDLRSMHGRLGLSIPICEKSLQYSFRCRWLKAQPKSTDGHWETIEQEITSHEVGSKSNQFAGGLFSRPVQFGLYNGNGPGKVIDIDNIKLIDESGKNLISNGDFENGTDFWFFSTDKHHPWHVLNLWVHVLFDQGWVGLIALVLLLVKAILNLFRNIYPDPLSAVLMSSLTGFLVVGTVDSPFDAPRLTLLFYLILFFALARPSNKNAASLT